MIVSQEPQLVAELQSVLAAFPEGSVVAHAVVEFRRAADAARNRQPSIAFVEMTGDTAALRALVREIEVASPETVPVAVFHPDVFPPDVPESTLLIEALRTGVRDFVRRPVSRRDVEQILERVHTAPVRSQATPATVAAFISNKGGVGKTTLAVNTAAGLALRHPDRVLLIDCSLQLSMCASLLGLQPATSLVDAVRERNRLDETLIRELAVSHAGGVDLLAAPADAIEATEVDDEGLSRVLTVARRAYDWVIVDTFPMFDRIVMTVLDLSDRAYVVIDNQVPNVVGISHLFRVLGEVGHPAELFSLIVNRLTSVPGGLKVADIEERLDRDAAHVIRSDNRMLTAANIGVPFVNSRRWGSRTRRSLLKIVDDVEQLRIQAATARPAARTTAVPPVTGDNWPEGRAEKASSSSGNGHAAADSFMRLETDRTKGELLQPDALLHFDAVRDKAPARDIR